MASHKKAADPEKEESTARTESSSAETNIHISENIDRSKLASRVPITAFAVLFSFGLILYILTVIDFSNVNYISQEKIDSLSPAISVLGLFSISVSFAIIVVKIFDLDIKLNLSQKSIGEASVQAAGATAILIVVVGGLYMLVERATNTEEQIQSKIGAAMKPLELKVSEQSVELTNLSEDKEKLLKKISDLENENRSLDSKLIASDIQLKHNQSIIENNRSIIDKIDNFNRFALGRGNIDLGIKVYCMSKFYGAKHLHRPMSGLKATENTEKFHDTELDHHLVTFNISRRGQKRIYFARQSKIKPGDIPRPDAILTFDFSEVHEPTLNVYLQRGFTPCIGSNTVPTIVPNTNDVVANLEEVGASGLSEAE